MDFGGFSGGDVFSAVGSYIGGQQANKTAKKIAREQMDFQFKMSNTAHRREVEDLRLAGLNPILSATGGSGASTPPGASAPVRNSLGEAINSAIAARAAREQVKNLQADTQLKKSQTDTSDNLGALYRGQYKNTEVNNALLSSQIPEAAANAKLYGSEYGSILKAVEKIAPAVSSATGAFKGLNPGFRLPVK